jgi:hypothetical protein
VDTEKQQAQTVPSVEPRPEHLWLQHLIGEWTIEAESGPGQPKVAGTETVRPLGDIWVLALLSAFHMDPPRLHTISCLYYRRFGPA